MPFENGIEEIKLAADANSFNTSILKNVPAGYELCVVGDVTFEGDSLKMPFENGIEEIKLAADANSFNTSILKNVPAGYELCVVGDVTFEGDSLNVEVRKAEKTVYVSYIDEETKMPFENGIEEIKVPADANSFNTSILKNVPAGYELCVVGDIAFEGDSLNVEVRKVVNFEYVKVTYVDADNGEFVVGYGTAKVEKGAAYSFEGDSLNVEVRKVVNFEYVKVTYVDADNGEFVVGYGTAKVEKGAAYFNTSTLTDVPYGYEIAEAGDMVIANGEATVKVRKIDNVQEVTITYVHKTTGDVVGYGKLNAYKDETYFNTSRLTDIPEGYVLADVGDMPIENGAATVYVYAATDMEELQPSTPVEPSSRLTDIPEGYVLADVGDMPIENGAATVYVYAATDMEELQPSTPVEPSKPVEPSTPVEPSNHLNRQIRTRMKKLQLMITRKMIRKTIRKMTRKHLLRQAMRRIQSQQFYQHRQIRTRMKKLQLMITRKMIRKTIRKMTRKHLLRQAMRRIQSQQFYQQVSVLQQFLHC